MLYCTLFLVLIACSLSSTYDSKQESKNKNQTGYIIPFVKREEWLARNPEDTYPLEIPVPYVVIHHTSTVPRCDNRESCKDCMQQIQNYHMDVMGWWDIGYNGKSSSSNTNQALVGFSRTQAIIDLKKESSFRKNITCLPSGGTAVNKKYHHPTFRNPKNIIPLDANCSGLYEKH